MVVNGTEYTAAPIVTVAAPSGGSTGVTALTIVNQGAGYVTAPILAIAGVTGATATATITDGKVTAVTITNPGHTATSAVVTASKPSTLKEITSNSIVGSIKKSSASGANVPAGR